MNEEQRFGIEVECLIDPSYRNEWAATWGSRGWENADDASIYYLGMDYHTLVMKEFKSPPLKGKKGLKEVEAFYSYIKSHGVKVNKSCGLHVHHEAYDYTISNFRSLVHLAAVASYCLRFVVSKHRRNNQYCSFSVPTMKWLEQIKKDTALGAIIEGWFPSRYSFINLKKWWASGTIEFRCHEASVDSYAVSRWIELTQCITRAAARFDYSKMEVATKKCASDYEKKRKISRLCTLASLMRLLALGEEKPRPAILTHFKYKRKVY